jgi:two-component system phosphate regulon sensor histidine kinase PhoR
MLDLTKEDFRKIINSAPAVTYVAKAYGDFGAKFVSSNIIERCGYTVQECLDNPNFWRDCLHPDEKENILAGFQDIFQSGKHKHEYRFRKKDGTYIWILDEVQLTYDDEGNPNEIIGSWLDISEQKKLEAILIENEGKIRKSDELKSNFISIAAHELNTPLTSIIGYAELLSDVDMNRNLSQKHKEDFLQEIVENCELLAKNIDDLLDVSLIESGKRIPLKKKETELEHVVSKIVRRYEMRSKHKFVVNFEKNFPKFVNIDQHRMNQILENLLSNAEKYSPTNSLIRIIVAEEGNHFSIKVIDQGIGMSPEVVSRIYDKFYRADESDTSVSGLGLGMSIVQQIVIDHGGNITVDSTEGEGTSVSLKIPVN